MIFVFEDGLGYRITLSLKREYEIIYVINKTNLKDYS